MATLSPGGLGWWIFPLYMANCHSSSDWQFKQPVAMALPTVILKAGWLRRWAARHFFRRVTRQGLVDPGSVIIELEGVQFPFKVMGVPEQAAVQILPPNRADQPLDSVTIANGTGTSNTLQTSVP